MKHGSYDKLNDRGFAPEETKLENNDAIFGKVTPIGDVTGTGKPYRDSSELFKMNGTGVVDRVYIDVQNQDGYSQRSAVVRCNKIPQIGDKYCFPEDANVEILTNEGWINVKNVTKKHKVAALVDNDYLEYQKPTGIYKFDYDGEIYKLRTEKVDIDVTTNHKLYVKLGNSDKYELIEAKDLIGKNYTLKKGCKNNECNKFEYGEQEKNNSNCTEELYKYKGNIYCLEVPSHIMMMRQNGKNVWIGNSSRHGQKGTIGILFDDVDMPFNKWGVRPDIILNPNAIPSRMTIGQLFECLVGKAAVLQGMDADGTAFEEHDIEYAKDVLEKLGYERNGYEYLYNGMTGEKMLHQIFIGPTFYQRLKHLVEDKIHCTQSDHDVLTSTGWKKITNITTNDKIATLNENDEIEYQNPAQVFDYPNYKGEMYHIKNQAIDLSVTGNHRMWTSKVYGRKKIWTEYDFEYARDIVGQLRRYKKDGLNVNDIYEFEFHELSDKIQIDINAWLTFFGIWYAEGCASCGKIQIAVHKQRVKDALYPALEKLGYTYKVYNNILINGDKELYAYMKPLSVGAPNKKMPDWVYKLDTRQTQLLINSMILGDGSISKRTGCPMYYTASKDLADQVQHLCLHAGWAGMISLHIPVGQTTQIRGKDVTNNYDILRISIIKKRINPCVNHGHTHTQEVQEESFNQHEKCHVVCVEVPNERFYVRRNGKAVWTGNSRARGPKTSLTRQAPEGRSIKVLVYSKDRLVSRQGLHI